MEILNAPTREVFCVGRDLTNTPLQALVILNDPQFVEASRRLAETALKTASDFDPRLDHITAQLLSRSFTPEERATVRRTLDQTLPEFRSNPEAAKTFIATGETKPDPDLDPADLAAWTLIASQILNLDETLNK